MLLCFIVEVLLKKEALFYIPLWRGAEGEDSTR
jgi:hypothetical protein